jgi:hypothetical protein
LVAKGGGRRGFWRSFASAFAPRGLSGFALLGFFLLSLMATGLGFADLRAANTDAEQLSAPELAFTIATTLFVVSAMVVALHAAIVDRRWVVKLLSVVFYLLFAVWSVGFGYGFFWKEFAGKEFTAGQFARVIDAISVSLDRTAGALATAEQSTRSAADLAMRRAESEAKDGRTCANHPSSTPGEGPLMRARFAFSQSAAALAKDVEDRWIAPLSGRRTELLRRVEALRTRTLPPDANQLPKEEQALLSKLTQARDLPSAERRKLFTSVHAEAEAFAAEANRLRQLNAGAFADRLSLLAAEVGPDPKTPGAADPARGADPGYCWDVVLNTQLASAAAQLRTMGDVETPPFEFLEGPKATRAAFFGLIGWIANTFGVKAPGGAAIPFGDKEFLALFASLAVDLGILFLTLLRDLPAAGDKPGRGGGRKAKGVSPKPPNLGSILDDEV